MVRKLDSENPVLWVETGMDRINTLIRLGRAAFASLQLCRIGLSLQYVNNMDATEKKSIKDEKENSSARAASEGACFDVQLLLKHNERES